MKACDDGFKSLQRSKQANAKMWAMLTDISRQVIWHGQRLEPVEWKWVLSAGLQKQKIVPNIEGNGFVVIGESTSGMTIKRMNEMIEMCEFFGGREGVRFSAPEYEGVAA